MHDNVRAAALGRFPLLALHFSSAEVEDLVPRLAVSTAEAKLLVALHAAMLSARSAGLGVTVTVSSD